MPSTLILAAEREGRVIYVQRELLPSINFLFTQAEVLLSRKNEHDQANGKMVLLQAARKADELCDILTGLVELEARGRKDQE